jgi:antibiotic biosynthesis monooxygenase (ABM) superfamily enzyme
MKHFYRKFKRSKKPLRRHQAKNSDIEDLAEIETWSTTSSESDWSKDDETSHQDIQAELRQHGLESHLSSQVCRKTPSQVKTTMTRITTFLMWLALKMVCSSSNSVLYLIYMLILEQYVLIPGYIFFVIYTTN